MKFTADTNILLRAAVEDDREQAAVAQKVLAEAELVAIAIPVLCEFCWVLARGYKIAKPKVAEAIRRFAFAENVAVDRPAVEAGLAMLDAGGDFADGTIAYSGRWMGAETFLSFDSEAVRLLKARGEPAQLLR